MKELFRTIALGISLIALVFLNGSCATAATTPPTSPPIGGTTDNYPPTIPAWVGQGAVFLSNTVASVLSFRDTSAGVAGTNAPAKNLVIERTTDTNGVWSIIATLPASATNFTDTAATGLTPSTTEWYRLRATN